MRTRVREWTPSEIAGGVRIALDEDDQDAVTLLLGLAGQNCVHWMGPFSAEGYPRWRNQKLHRVIYRLMVGEPSGTLTRTCRQHACINPRHMVASGRRSGGCGWESAPERFSQRISKDGPPFRDLGPCWQWDVVHPESGYGTFYEGSKNVLAHRWSYEAHVGAIPEGLQIDHLCRNRGCVNPHHLEAVTPLVNSVRGIAARKGHDWLQGTAS